MPAINDKQHIGWIDYAKAFAIYCVVLLHTHCVESLTVALKGFVMPLFFFISGFLFLRARNPELGPFFRKRCHQLLVPYLWINAVAYILWLLVLRHYGTDTADSIEWHRPLLGIALGIPRFLVHDIPLWSILCFFVVEMIYYALPHKGKWNDLIIAAIAYLTGSIISIYAGQEGIALPLTLAPSATALAFYALGHFVRSRSDEWRLLFKPSPAILLFGLVLLFAGVSLNSPTAFFLGSIGNPVPYLIGAIGGIIMSVQLAVWLDKIFHDGKLVRLISRGTLIICGFHLIAFAFMKGVMLLGFGVAPETLTDSFWKGIIFSIFATSLCLPLIMLIERRFKFLVGK